MAKQSQAKVSIDQSHEEKGTLYRIELLIPHSVLTLAEILSQEGLLTPFKEALKPELLKFVEERNLKAKNLLKEAKSILRVEI